MLKIIEATMKLDLLKSEARGNDGGRRLVVENYVGGGRKRLTGTKSFKLQTCEVQVQLRLRVHRLEDYLE